MLRSPKLLSSLALGFAPLAMAAILASGPAAGDEMKFVEHADTDAVTDTGASGVLRFS
jgi:hypothetical protein